MHCNLYGSCCEQFYVEGMHCNCSFNTLVMHLLTEPLLLLLYIIDVSFCLCIIHLNGKVNTIFLSLETPRDSLTNSPLNLVKSSVFQVTMIESRTSAGFFKKQMRIEADPSDFH